MTKSSFPLSLCVILLAFAASGCGSGPTSTATPPPAVATPTEAGGPAQAPSPEPPVASDLPRLLEHLHWLGHASFRLDGPPTIYFDPTSLGGEESQADIILISHLHDDHYSPNILKKISTPETVIVISQLMTARLEGDGVPGEVRGLKPGEKTTIGEVEIETVPAYNIDKSYHPKEAEHLGFIVTWQGERLYFAGDTDRIPEMAGVDCDVALLPIGGTYTMDAEEAAQAAADIGPKVAVPMHTRSADPEEFRNLCDCEVVIVEIEF
jgi:L-ascorbate metabolism protein UlaG (beta-lactamase superfamily)